MNHERPRFSYLIATQLFLRSLGIIYLLAIGSLWVQIEGLLGSTGILPITDYLNLLQKHFSADAYLKAPTLLWIDANDATLHFLCGLGCALALHATVFPFGWIQWFALWGVYLSLTIAGQTFLNFQWDILLLEVGFLSIFLAPCAIRPRFRCAAPPSTVMVWLSRWLLARFMLLSGLVKIASNDPAWQNLTALEYHYMTQPLPPWSAWFVHQWSPWFHSLSTGIMFFVELVVPLFVFMPRFMRLVAASFLVSLQVVIIATGNYCFFNILAIALCFSLIDDQFIQWSIAKIRRSPPADEGLVDENAAAPTPRAWPTLIVVPIATVLFALSLVPTANTTCKTFGWPTDWTAKVHPYTTYARAVHLANGYGLFANMTTDRPEIVIEGSNDGTRWTPYEFSYKPGRLDRRPGFVAPHMPRLDWQMWFAALGTVQRNPWFVSLCVHLMEGTPEVLTLLETNPFVDAPPKFIRAKRYLYKFTTPEERAQTGHWWKRTETDMYFGPVSLRDR